MIKLTDIVKSILKEGGKLFGDDAQRVTTDEMYSVFDEIKKKLANKFDRFNISTKLASKTDHGDIDIIVLPKKGESTKTVVLSTLENNIVKNQDGKLMVSTNDNILSILYLPTKLDKQVHVDFITSDSEDDFETKETYLAYNDFSGMVGVMSRKLGFKYGTEGFFKIFTDNKGQNHDILITKNLRDGLKILGFRNVDTNFSNVRSEDDIVEFIKTSPLFDVRHYTTDLNRGDLKKMRSARKSAQYIRDELIKSNQHRSIEDNDHFFKQMFPDKYAKVESEKERLYVPVVNTSKYTGEWIINTFNLKPGPTIGNIKSFLEKTYGNKLNDMPEEQVISSVKQYLKI
jgi:hypothetical protein